MSFQDVRMSVEEIFYFPRVDVFSAADDHVLDPADDPAVAVLVNNSDVPKEINKIITRSVTCVNTTGHETAYVTRVHYSTKVNKFTYPE